MTSLRSLSFTKCLDGSLTSYVELTKRKNKSSKKLFSFCSGERPYRCEICDKAFNQKNALQVHLRKHSGEKPHICPYCDASFVQSGNLKTHIKRAHHADMVSSMNISKTEVESRQDLAKSHIGTGLGEEQRGGMEGDDVGSVVDGMDLGEDVDLFVQQMG